MIKLSRRLFIGSSLMVIAGCGEAKAAAIMVHRDPDCGCCETWTSQLRANLNRPVEVFDSPDRKPLQDRAAMPADLGSCHTAIIDGLIFEGHVPFADIKRLIATRPVGVNGLAVPGMPVGSPGMETDPPRLESYDVVAFGAIQPYVFTHYD